MKKVDKDKKTKQICLFVSEKMELKIKRMMKKDKFKSMSETIRYCVEQQLK
jgi:Arc/MetJ-type ribon-helix-helix transcriptional regulator